MTSHKGLRAWVDDIAELTGPRAVHWCDGSDDEYGRLCEQLVAAGTFARLTASERPGSYLARCDPADVAAVVDGTFVCCARERDAGPTNNWREPGEMLDRLLALFDGSMEGRTMYVVPFSMGPLGSQLSRIGVQLTDSAYVAASMRLLTRMGQAALDVLGEDGEFVRCVHTVGMPLTRGVRDVPWPSDRDCKCIVHFPESREIWSYGSAYGVNALPGKKYLGLRIASVIARDEGWLAEHMLILKLTSPERVVRYVAAAFPSGCGRTTLAMLTPALPGWKVEMIGDDVAWMRFDDEGRLRAINPEAGFFEIAARIGERTSATATGMLARDTIFTNCALTDDGDVWWEGMTEDAPSHLIDWRGGDWTPDAEHPAAHPDGRFAVAAAQCPSIAPEWDDAAGVPISAVLFGGRRSAVAPLVREAFDWEHGVLLAATMSLDAAAASGTVGEVRYDPFAMLPFCGYHMADHFSHWLRVGQRAGAKLPRMYTVNWFRKNEQGEFMWPGYGENARVLAWIFRRCDGSVEARATLIGLVPYVADLDLRGLKVAPAVLHELLDVDHGAVRAELSEATECLNRFGDRVPRELRRQLGWLQTRLAAERASQP